MSKSLNRFLRKFHRRLALPTVILILTIMLACAAAMGALIQRGRPILMLATALTGLYLFQLPHFFPLETQTANARRINQVGCSLRDQSDAASTVLEA
ncbi:MAG: hypothetical protein P1P76_04195 [Anaerolineales bacterium]|nr:hypothetical protein [Anaerolineales bacterium]